MRRRILVMLSSYNGEKYIAEQIDSILSQTVNDIDILIRDDGSKDGTIEILENYSLKYKNIKLVLGENLGVIRSFFTLVKIAKLNYDYYMFADQDDYWVSNKVEKMIAEFKKFSKNEKLGYCSNLILVDKYLNFMKIQYNNELRPSLQNSFLENIVTGCTYAANKNMFIELKKDIQDIDPWVENLMMHDAHFYFLTCLYGRLIYDKNSYIYYRQHGNNVIGMEKNFIKRNSKRIKNFFRKNRKNIKINYLSFILKRYGEKLPVVEKNMLLELLNNYSNFILRLKTMCKVSFVRQNKYEALCLKIIYVLKRF